MKNVTRAFVLALVITGAVASTEVASPRNAKSVVVTTAAGVPTPTCPAGDPNGCGMFGK